MSWESVDEWPRNGTSGVYRGAAEVIVAERSDLSFFERVVQVSATLIGDEAEVNFAITSQRVGHAFPTGDVYRSLRFGVSNGDAEVEEIFTRRFAFRVTEDGRGHKLEEVEDTRLLPRETRRGRLVLPAAETLEWSLELHRLAPEDAQRRGLSDEQTRHVLSQGVLRPAHD